MKQKIGFTVIEMLVVILITMLIIIMLVPDYQYIVEKKKISLTTQEFYRSIQFAKIQAIRLKKTMIFCGSSQIGICDGNWSLGYTILQKDKLIIKKYHQVRPGIYVEWKGFSHQPFLQFEPSGLTKDQNGTFRIRSKNHIDWDLQGILRISKSGRVRIE